MHKKTPLLRGFYNFERSGLITLIVAIISTLIVTIISVVSVRSVIPVVSPFILSLEVIFFCLDDRIFFLVFQIADFLFPLIFTNAFIVFCSRYLKIVFILNILYL